MWAGAGQASAVGFQAFVPKAAPRSAPGRTRSNLPRYWPKEDVTSLSLLISSAGARRKIFKKTFNVYVGGISLRHPRPLALPCSRAYPLGRRGFNVMTHLRRVSSAPLRRAAGLNAVPGETAQAVACYGAESSQAARAGYHSRASQKPLWTWGQLFRRGEAAGGLRVGCCCEGVVTAPLRIRRDRGSRRGEAWVDSGSPQCVCRSAVFAKAPEQVPWGLSTCLGKTSFPSESILSLKLSKVYHKACCDSSRYCGTFPWSDVSEAQTTV
jgi:hypothetical protein